MMYVLFTYIVDDCNERGGVYNLLRTHWIRSSLSTMTTFHSLLSLHNVCMSHVFTELNNCETLKRRLCNISDLNNRLINQHVENQLLPAAHSGVNITQVWEI